MNIATQKSNLGKTQAIHIAEAQSERWISWVRLAIASAFALVALYAFALNRIPLSSFCMQAGASAVMFLYSMGFLSNSRRLLVQGYAVFALAFLDVTVVSVFLWGFSIAGLSPLAIHAALFCAYFIAIAFTAMHHRASLAVFAGLVSVLEYTVLAFLCFSPPLPAVHNWPYVYAASSVVLIMVALLSGFISRKNFLSIQKVALSEVRYHNLVHRLPQMLFTLDKEGKFLWSNMASFTIIGIPSKAISGRNIRDYMVNAESFRLEKMGVRGTYQVKDFNGNVKFVDCTISPADKDENGVVWEGSKEDVTDRELALTQREEMGNRLFQYQKMESLSTLASGMAHDFNNILQTSYDIIDRVGTQTREDNTRRNMMLLSETLTDAKFLVSELLAIGRKQPLDYSALDVGHFITDIVPLYRDQLGPNYRLDVDVPPQPLWIQGDANYLKRIFQNFVGNARDAMPGGGTMTIQAFPESKAGETGTVVIRVSDTGTGIPPGIVDKIFDPFFTTKKAGKGTGLGLTLVRKIVTLHNGQIRVEKTGATGTTFRIEIPESEQGGEGRDTKFIMMHRRTGTLLLLDDDHKIRDILKFFLTDFGYKVIEGANSEEGVAVMEQHKEDCRVVIMDWRLAGENPHKVIDKLRSVNPQAVIIVVSGYPPREKSIEEMNIFRWFTKPYDKNRLDLEVQKALYVQPKNGPVS
jgi:PAS domain S-box-containing protein